jgi:gas vesicle protein
VLAIPTILLVNQNDQVMTNGKAILAMLASVAAGAALGMLLAPNKGADTRKKISKKGEELADALNDNIEALLKKI